MQRRSLVLLGAVAASSFTILIIINPLLFEYGRFVGLDGAPSVMDHSWSVSECIYALGDLLCHQQYGRSFILNGSQMPFCIRDLGLIIGLSTGLIACFINDRWSDRKSYLRAGVLLLCVTAAEWGLEHFIDIDWPIRFATAIVSGIGAAMILCWALYRERPLENRV
jgi:uncharacterized membrane protein